MEFDFDRLVNEEKNKLFACVERRFEEEDVERVKESGKEHFLMFATASGTVRRNRMSDFDSIRAKNRTNTASWE